MKLNGLHIIILFLACAAFVLPARSDDHRKAVSLMLQGVQALEQGNTEFAKQALKAAETIDPEDDAIQYYLGYIAAGESNANEALKHFEAAWKRDSTNYWYGLRLGKIYTIMRKTDEAKRVNDFLLASHPNDAEVMSYAIDLALQKGDVDRADSLLNRIDVLVGPSDYSRMTRLEILRQKGDFTRLFASLKTMFEDEEIPGKVKKELIENMMNRSDPRFNYVHISDYDSLFTTCVRVHPTDTGILHYAAGFYYEINRNDRLIKLCDAHSDDPRMVLFKMFACMKAKDYKKTLEACDDLIRVSTDKEDILSAITAKADCYQRLGQNDAAFREYERALKIAPDDVTVLNNYAYYLSVVGRNLSKAARMSKKVIAQHPENATFLDTYGWILYKQKKYSAAKIYLKKAILYGGKESAEVLDHYADVLEALGEDSLAVGYHQQAMLRRDEPKK